MTDGIQWLVDLDRWDTAVMFARGIPPAELAARMGAAPGSELPAVTETEAWEAAWTEYDAVVRVGSSGDWAFAVEYGDCRGSEMVDAVSREGVEAVHLDPQPEHPPKQFSYGRDGKPVCSFGIGEERWRWGSHCDLLVPRLTAAGILRADGEYALPEDGSYRERDRRTLAVIEDHFGLALPWELVIVGRLAAYALDDDPDADPGAGPGPDALRR